MVKVDERIITNSLIGNEIKASYRIVGISDTWQVADNTGAHLRNSR